MRIALLDPFAGVAGDMLVGALVDAGAPFSKIRAALRSLPLDGFTVSCRAVQRCGMQARKFRVRQNEDHHHRGLRVILKILDQGDLTDGARARAASAFRLLAEAEAKVHGTTVDKVHFHEVGAVDSICDIVGAAVALDLLEVERIYARPLPMGNGSVQAAHGRIPLPAPATLELLRGRPTYESGLLGELVTPTGAACVQAWADAGECPPFVPGSIGYGAGDRDPEDYPNVCRVTVGELTPETEGPLFELRCEVDDATPQVLGHLLERLLERGALDAHLQPVQMKKGRPGSRVTVLSRQRSIPALEELLFAEGTTLGVRRHAVDRTALPRRIQTVRTKYGPVGMKVGRLGRRIVHAEPEYEDLKRLAREHDVPLREVRREALRVWES